MDIRALLKQGSSLEELEQSLLDLDSEFDFKCRHCGKCCKNQDTVLFTPVLAICYEEQCAASDFVRMRYALYISKSKGGAQYLDSLDGQVKVSREGSFKAFPFLVLPSNEMAAIS